MPTEEIRAHLAALYAANDDPFGTFSSAYEDAKFADTLACLPRARYVQGIEVGCGTGALSRRLAVSCDRLMAVDITPRAIEVARAQGGAANVAFVLGTAPPLWPTVPPDLVVLSEVLYFMTLDETVALARRIDAGDHACDVVLVNWLGITGHDIDGGPAADRFIGLIDGFDLHPTLARDAYRIDVLRRGA